MADSIPAHVAAFKYIMRQGPYPTESQMSRLRPSLARSVECVADLEDEIDRLKEEIARVNSENGKLHAEITNSYRPANIDIIATKPSEITGPATPCGQVLKISQANGPDVYATCIVAGMPAYGGRCPIHSVRALPPVAAATAAAAVPVAGTKNTASAAATSAAPSFAAVASGTKK